MKTLKNLSLILELQLLTKMGHEMDKRIENQVIAYYELVNKFLERLERSNTK